MKTDAARPAWRAVAVPSEHGGWGLSVEPGLLGVIIVPAAASVALALAAVLAFVVRTPLKLALVDRARHRRLDRTRLAERIAMTELTVLAGLAMVATVAGSPRLWIPLAAAAPLVMVQLLFDRRSHGRRLAPELAGSTAVAAVAASILMAAGDRSALAMAMWMVLAARNVTSVTFVRMQVSRLHRRPAPARPALIAMVAAVVLAGAAAAVDHHATAGALAVTALVMFQVTTWKRPVSRAAVIGVQQTAAGLAVVLVAALGAIAP